MSPNLDNVNNANPESGYAQSIEASHKQPSPPESKKCWGVKFAFEKTVQPHLAISVFNKPSFRSITSPQFFNDVVSSKWSRCRTKWRSQSFLWRWIDWEENVKKKNDLYTMVKPCEIFHNPTNHHLWREEAVVTWSLLLLGEDGEGTKKHPKMLQKQLGRSIRCTALRYSGVMENPNNK